MGRCCYNGAGGELPSDEWSVVVVVIFSPGNLEKLKKPDDCSNERKAGHADVLFEAGLTRGQLAKAVLVRPVGHISRSPPR
jgi:hypothetical protein